VRSTARQEAARLPGWGGRRSPKSPSACQAVSGSVGKFRQTCVSAGGELHAGGVRQENIGEVSRSFSPCIAGLSGEESSPGSSRLSRGSLPWLSTRRLSSNTPIDAEHGRRGHPLQVVGQTVRWSPTNSGRRRIGPSPHNTGSSQPVPTRLPPPGPRPERGRPRGPDVEKPTRTKPRSRAGEAATRGWCDVWRLRH